MDNYGRTPLSRAAGSGDVRVMAQLLQQDSVNPYFKDEGGRTPLSQAAGNGLEEMIKHLLAESGVEPDSKDKHRRTPLWWAAAAGHTVCTRLLLENGEVDPESKDIDGWTPLLCAVENGHKPTTREFIRKDRVMLNMLVMKGNLTHLQMLIENGHNVNNKCMGGQTPLHAAALSGYANITEELLRRKAIVNCKDNSGTTPLQLAIQRKHQEVILVLLENSAETTGILPIHWLDAYNREASDILELSQTLRGKKSLRFSQGMPLQISKLTRRLS